MWIEFYAEEDGSFIENLNVGRAERSRLRYESMRERSIAGGGSTGKKGGRVPMFIVTYGVVDASQPVIWTSIAICIVVLAASLFVKETRGTTIE